MTEPARGLAASAWLGIAAATQRVATQCYPCHMDPKPRPNHQLYLEALRRMTPEQRLLKAFELTELSHELLHAGVRRRFPDAGDDEVQSIYLERLTRCHNRAS